MEFFSPSQKNADFQRVFFPFPVDKPVDNVENSCRTHFRYVFMFYFMLTIIKCRNHIYFLVSAQESIKESGIGEAFMTRCRAPNAPSPMYLSRAHRRRCLCGCTATGGRKSEHLRREVAKQHLLTTGGDSKGGVFVKSPLWLTSLVPFLFSDKKGTYIPLIIEKAPPNGGA